MKNEYMSYLKYKCPIDELDEILNNENTKLLLNLQSKYIIKSNDDMYKSKLYYDELQIIFKYFDPLMQKYNNDLYDTSMYFCIDINNIYKLKDKVVCVYQFIHKSDKIDCRYHEYMMIAYITKYINK